MKLVDLKSGEGKVDVIVKVKSKDEPRSMIKFGKELVLCNAVVEDDSGEMKMTLWNDDVTKVKKGDKIHITNGYVNEFQGEKQLTAGRFGKIEILEEAPKEEGSEEGDEVSEEESREAGEMPEEKEM
ncbi:DNA-binding protein [Candidatus Pacearchaeota archaeon CG10_big_fil_rev_8_21_14_0_10_35_219]|nr:DNA-binding protein [Candidatus Pacearchaeota archaeon]OIO42060.1 MAG: hypothetical protein AUJ63_04175 [Candidatus Pacearchaeota archaeon CG1_02_35_32]PIO07619.1 MAG: DNA-binding protein [Candidatus Pacearchaeota archaeon CG10_big_fil_rev_8_21_14_0_10_35_219]PIY81143.1 MAG: DNA-binding protein [Candidatus Pacearchaeota archaeon CG_4_10_14_0_8_um_filter_35_169]PIZ79740.1 MAG: DNA-binding protein [Candidatus Pacearchaeota archaeon CG_4_10_14_0_2_um_filter_35_33]PJA70327.1 MAG: DNA-binding pr